jgi:hypothetical protein
VANTDRLVVGDSQATRHGAYRTSLPRQTRHQGKHVTIYHVLFVSWCTNGSWSVFSTLLFVSVDLGETLLSYSNVRNMHAELMTLLQLSGKASRSRGPTSVIPAGSRGDGALSLLDVGIAIWEHDRDKVGAHSDVQRISDTRPAMVWQSKCLSARLHPISPASNLTQMDNLETRATVAVKSVLMTTVQPIDPSSKSPDQSTRSIVASLSLKEREQCLQLVLRLLHTSEFLLLIEFVEAIVPVIYRTSSTNDCFRYCLLLLIANCRAVVYLAGIYYLPNRKYFDIVRDLDEAELTSQIANLAVYTLLEIGSLALLCWLLQRKLGFSPIKQLAFVLESQWDLVQSKLMMWVLFAVHSRLEHFGTDFSFQFAWLSDKHQLERSDQPFPFLLVHPFFRILIFFAPRLNLTSLI